MLTRDDLQLMCSHPIQLHIATIPSRCIVTSSGAQHFAPTGGHRIYKGVRLGDLVSSCASVQQIVTNLVGAVIVQEMCTVIACGHRNRNCRGRPSSEHATPTASISP